MRKILFLFVFSATGTLFFAQRGDYKRHMVEGNFLLLEENYMRALTEFQKAYAFDSTNANVNYKIGFCYLKHPSEKHLAEKYFEKAITNVSSRYDDEDPLMKSAPPIAYFYLAKAYHLDYKFEEALNMFDTYKSYLNAKKYKAEIELVEHHESMCRYAHERVGSPANVRIVNMGDSVNSKYAEVSPVLSADERLMIFTYAGPMSTGAAYGNRTPEDGYFEDIFVCYKDANGVWSQPDTLPGTVNGNGHEGAVGLSADGQTLIIYRDDNGDGNLYFTIWNGVEWDSPIKFGSDINSQYWEPSACLSPDGNTLYFVSNRPGGFGGRDIYRCKKLSNGNWSKAQNLGPKINTKYDEESPFVHPNGEDFFFSSQGHTSMGGFDIFYTIMDSAGVFDSVVPLQYPINTTDDDEFYVSSPDNKRAYYASSHEDHAGFGEQDLYMISIAQDLEANEVLALFRGQVVPDKGDTLPHGITIIITNKKTGVMVGTYRPQRNGNFSCILQPSNTYAFSYQLDGKEFYKEEIDVPGEFSFQEIEREIPLNPVTLKIANSLPDPIKNDISLQVSVLDLKDFRELGTARITLADNKGNKYSIIADSSGKSPVIYLEGGRIYSLRANYGEFGGDSVIVSTVGIKGEKNFNTTVYVSTLKETYNVDSLVAGKFIHYFEFNQTAFDHFHNYPLFLQEIDKAIAANSKLSIKIRASASKVPTKTKGGLPGLAKSRAEALEKKLLEYLVSKGVDPAKVKFQITTSVGGPPYKKDFLHHIREYEKYQFVEAEIR